MLGRVSIAAILLLASPALARDKHAIEVKFDRFRNITTFDQYMSPIKVNKIKSSTGRDINIAEAMLGASFVCPGQVSSCVPSFLTFVLHFETREWTFMGATTAIFLIDEKPIPVQAIWSGHVESGSGGGTYFCCLSETLTISVTPEFFRNLTESRLVEIQIKDRSFAFTDKNTAKLKDMLAYLK